MDEQGVVYNAWSRTNSYFQNTGIRGQKLPHAAELVLLAPMKKDLPSEDLYTNLLAPPVSKGDGYDRDNPLKADKLLNEAAGCRRVSNALMPQRVSHSALNYCFPQARRNSQWVLLFQHSLQRLGINMDIRKVDNQITATA